MTDNPCRIELLLDRLFPAEVLGPALLRALARLAVSFLRDVIVLPLRELGVLRTVCLHHQLIRIRLQ
jgi:hypothetical protein